MKKILKKKSKPAKKSLAPKKAVPKPRKTKPSTPTPKPDETDDELVMEHFSEDFEEPKAEPTTKASAPLSNFPERKMLEKFASDGNPKLITEAQILMVKKCDPKHPCYDRLFAECVIKQAKNESTTTVAEASLAARNKIETPYKVEMEGEYDPAEYVQEGDVFCLFKQSASFSLYESKSEPRVYRLIHAGTRDATPHTKIDGIKTSFLPPPDQTQWDEV